MTTWLTGDGQAYCFQFSRLSVAPFCHFRHKKNHGDWTSRSAAPPGGSLGGPNPPAAAHYRPRLVGDEAGNSHPRPQFHEEQGGASFAAPERLPRVGLRPCQADGNAGRAPADEMGGLDR